MDKIKQESVLFFQKLFDVDCTQPIGDSLDFIPRIVTEEDNANLVTAPTMEEVKKAVFSLSSDSAVGVDGFNRVFYKTYWHILADYLFKAVEDFFFGGSLTKAITRTLLCLIPKVKYPATFMDFRPISLCTFASKVFSKILANRMGELLPKIISH
ncbi:hypothetical protein ACH5RR_009172 [Cinchona calisaya]|uniref:Reverse transcriptase n=1 Tax=Cinchona calisaya TaxID=153742 RepID=A0ABD3ADE6_9GENT